jgi:SAM-dependent methyltransferase
MIKNFIKFNRNFCKNFCTYLPQARIAGIYRFFEEVVGKYANSRNNQVIVDVGAGNSCHFINQINKGLDNKIIGIDVNLESLRNNVDVNEKLVGNVISGFPFKNDSIDIIVSRSVVEHLDNVEKFIINLQRVLRKGGYSIHAFPSKFAPFAVINQLLPNKLSRKILFYIFPESKGQCGFVSFYNKCYFSAIKTLFEKYNFEIIDIHISYMQSHGYFGFFIPLFLIVAFYEMLLYYFGAKNLCAYILVITKKL